MQTVFHTAHTLKGASSNLGATVLADLCEDISAGCRAGNLAEVAQQVERLEAEYSRVQTMLEHMSHEQVQ